MPCCLADRCQHLETCSDSVCRMEEKATWGKHYAKYREGIDSIQVNEPIARLRSRTGTARKKSCEKYSASGGHI
jgi:hypothetical protein